jgi:hypothetical protein
MPVTYARYVHRKLPPATYSSVFEQLEEDSILLFDPVLEATTTGIGDLYRRLDLGLRSSEIVIFRGDSEDFVGQIEADPLLKSALTDKQAMALIASGGSAQAFPQLHPIVGFTPTHRLPPIESLRHVELIATLMRAGAIFDSGDYHYQLPSGWHAEKFVRLGDAFRSPFDIRRISNWLIPHIHGDTVVIADTGSMLPLLLEIREQAHVRFGWRVELATFDTYPQDDVAVVDAIAAIQNRPIVAAADADERGFRFLFLISVNSSGRLCNLLRRHCPANSEIIVICETSASEEYADHSLVRMPITRWKTEADGRCEQCSKTLAIRVHPESYELLPVINRNPVKVTRSRAEAARDFWTMADNAEAIKLHVNVPYTTGPFPDYRHFSVFLDTARLIQFQPFRNLCLSKIKLTAPPDMVVIPDHATSEIVEQLCREAFSTVPIHRIPPGRLSPEIQAILAKAKRLLVADDAIVSGITLFNLRGELFRSLQQMGSSPEVNVFVAVSRPAWGHSLRAIKRRYSGQVIEQILCGAEVFLPDGQNCPWCREHSLLTKFRPRLAGNSLAIAQQRIDRLEGPMSAPLLMVAAIDAQTNLKTLGSYFGELNQRAAFAAGVCAAQTLIDELGTPGHKIQLNVVDTPMIIESYFEGVLLASLLRTFDALHTRNPAGEELTCDVLAKIRPAQAYPGLIAELGIAALHNKLPHAQVRNLIEAEKETDPWLQMISELMDFMFN